MEQYFKNKKVGIWGLGAVGKSTLSFLTPFECQISVCDKRKLEGHEISLLEGHQAQFVPHELLPQFFEMNDIIIASPGINIKPLGEYKEKLVCELDLFAALVKKPTIAITGSIGKTTTVHVLTHLLNKLGVKALAAGNIGLPLLDAIAQQDEFDMLVLELSSFQLQHHKIFSPDIAAITNFYPNHLDQHEDIEEYLTAKGQLFAHQKETQKAIIPMTFMDELWPFTCGQKITWLASDSDINITKKLSDITCLQNWQIVFEVLEHLQLPTNNIAKLCAGLPPLPNRIEYVGAINGTKFYNDSKATIPEATLQAVTQFKNPVLFLGGLSKGVDRSYLISQLKGKVKHVICFGAEAQKLHQLCQTLSIKSSKHTTLEEAFEYCMSCITKTDEVLFSPAGSSFDLFKNYVERGNAFKIIFSQY